MPAQLRADARARNLARLAADLSNWGRWVRASDTKLGFPPLACTGAYVHTKEDAEDCPKADLGADITFDEVRAVWASLPDHPARRRGPA